MANNKLAYGLAEANGINTEGMSPKEVWKALKGKGITPQNAKQHRAKVEESKREEVKKKFASDEVGDSLSGGEDVITFERKKPKEFRESLSKAKETIELEARWRVTLHDEIDYANDKLFVTKGGSCVAVTPDGDIISVCKNNGEHGVAKKLLRKAIKEGGTKLDAYGSRLFVFYTSSGFEPVSWIEWNVEYAPDEWIEAKKKGLKAESEPIVFYKYTGKEKEGTDAMYKEFLKIVSPSKDYDDAKQLRDKEIKNGKNDV